MTKKDQTGFRLTPEARQMLKELAEKLGVSQAAIIELLIRAKHKREFIKRKKDDK